MRREIFLILLFVFFSLPSFALADTIVSGSISSDTTWSPSGGVYIIDSSFSVSAGATLTIEPGTIVKSKITGMLGLGILGNIVAHGTSEAPIYFTSWSDDSVGGDTNSDGESTGTPGSWQGLYFKSGSTGSFDYINLSYAGNGGPYAYDYGHLVGIENDGGIVDIQHSNIINNYKDLFDWVIGPYRGGYAVYNKSGTLSVGDSVIDNSANGINIESGSAKISNNIIKNNNGYGAGYGIYASGSESLTLTNNTFSNNRRTAYISVSKNFIHSGNVSEDQTNKGFEMSGVISEDTTFTGEDLPYIIQSLTINNGKTLTLEPGTILKMSDYYSSGAIYVQGGNLIAKGTPENKIYITSLKDDSVGGDTNGDDNTSIPAPKNWNAIYLEGTSKADFDNVIVSYGGYNYNGEYLPGVAAVIYDRGANLSIFNSFIGHNNGAGIYKDAGIAIISKTEFAGDGFGVWSRGGSISISQCNFDNVGFGINNQSGLDLGWWWQTKPLQIIDARNNWWGSADGPKDISTSTPTGNGSLVSENVIYKPFLTEPPSDEPVIQTTNPVVIIPGIMGSAKKNGQLLIDPILHTYDDLIATLIANGYVEGKDLFTFPYEWRDSNILTANLLKDKINQVKQTCLVLNLPDINCNKVDLVAHSMGGLVAREYIQSGQYQNDVDQVIFLGTPHKGSPKAYLQWEGGEFPPGGTTDKLIKLFFQTQAYQNGHLSIFDYIHNHPIQSVQELLPTFNYLKDKDAGILRIYPNNYPKNTFLEYLNNDIYKLLNSGVKITNIIGNSGNNTIEKIRVVAGSDSIWVSGKPDGFDGETVDRGLERGSGDGTVTTFGSTLGGSVQNEEWSGASHNQLPRETSARIFNILTGKNAENVVYFAFIEKILSIQLQSPIDFVITDPNGKKMGKNFQTGGEYNEIPDAFYSGFNNGDDEYITVSNPLDGNYKIEVQGTGNGGEYGVLTSYISDTFATTTETTGITKSNQITELNTVVDNTNPEKLETERKITLEVLMNDINGAYDLGWIKNIGIKTELTQKIEKIYKDNKKTNKDLVKALLTDLKLYRKEKINEQAYNIIKEDLNWLILNN
ncbi:MAG: right-handed parallel beta-helix repeat-containing protein [Patescibacteria group bacterium]